MESNKQSRTHDFLFGGVRRLNVENDTCNSKCMIIDRRVAQIETMIGVQACRDETTGQSLI